MVNLVRLLQIVGGVFCVVLGLAALILWSSFVWAYALSGALVTAGLVMVASPFVRRGASRDK